MKPKFFEPNIDELDESFFRMSEAERQFEIISPRLNWKMLMELEPRLAHMLHDARNADSKRESDYFCGQEFWHRELKPQLVEVIGYGRDEFHPILGTSAAYDIAYDLLLAAVAPCRGCSCCE